VLDAMTNGGIGIAFWAPFDGTRYYLPWRPIVVSPLGVSRFLSPWGVAVMVSEVLWVWLPALAFTTVAWALTRAAASRDLWR
jgi:inner membrane protein